MPDIIAKFYDDTYLVVELKGNVSKRNNAIEQINSGIEFLVLEFKIKPKKIRKKFVVYKKEGYYYEQIRSKYIPQRHSRKA